MKGVDPVLCSMAEELVHPGSWFGILARM